MAYAMPIPKDFYLLSAPDDAEGVAYARKYVADMRLQPDEVRLFKDGGFVYVKTKREINLKKDIDTP